MSVFRRKNTKTDLSPAGLSQERERRRVAFWITGSILVHLMAVLVLCLTPVRQILLSSKKPENLPISTRRVEQVAEHVRQRENRDIETKLRELLNIEQQMKQIQQEKKQDYEELASDLRQTSQNDIQQSQERVLEAQKTAADALDQVQELQSELLKSEEAYLAALNDPAEDARPTQEKVKQTYEKLTNALAAAEDAQTYVLDLQKQVAQRLEFAPETFGKVAEAQALAHQAQAEALKLRDHAASRLSGDRNFKASRYERAVRDAAAEVDQVAKAQQRIENSKKNLEKAKNELAELATNLDQMTAQQQALQQAIDAAAEQLKTAEAQVKKTDTPDTRQAAKEAKQQLEAAQKELDALNRKKSEAKRTTLPKERSLAYQQRQLSEAEKQKTQHEERRDANLEKEKVYADQAAKNQRAAEEARKAALEAQQQAIAAQKKVQTLLAAVEPPEADEQKGAAANEQPETVTGIFKTGRTIPESYAEAVEAEKRIAEVHRQIQAAETAVQAQMPLEKALSITEAPKIERPNLDMSHLTATASTPGEFAAFKDELKKVDGEMNLIVSAAQELLSMNQPKEEDATTLSLAQMKAKAEMANALRTAAAQSQSSKFKDMTALMKSAEAAEGEKSSEGPAEPPQKGGSPSSGEEGNAGASQTAAAAGGPGYGQPGGISSINLHDPQFAAMRIADSAQTGVASDDWVYLNTWYTIGPFPNPDRSNIDKKFPPESVINLDASYPGKGGRTVHWRFVQNTYPLIKPPNTEEYGIWYAYTEVWFDEPQDLVIAVGSDDYSRMWINGQLVWMSGRHLKGWRVAEGLRKVHFRKGSNRILYRVENGWLDMAFSLMINLQK